MSIIYSQKILCTMKAILTDNLNMMSAWHEEFPITHIAPASSCEFEINNCTLLIQMLSYVINLLQKDSEIEVSFLSKEMVKQSSKKTVFKLHHPSSSKKQSTHQRVSIIIYHEVFQTMHSLKRKALDSHCRPWRTREPILVRYNQGNNLFWFVQNYQYIYVIYSKDYFIPHFRLIIICNV